MVRIMTFIGMVMGLDAPSLHAQYFEEYVSLASRLERVIIVTDDVRGGLGDAPKGLRVLEVPAIRIPKIYGATKIMFYCLAALFNMRRYDVLYVRTFSPPELLSLWAARRIARKPCLLVIPGTWLFGDTDTRPRGKERIYRWFLRRALHAASRVVVYSSLMISDVARYAPGMDRSKIMVVRNAVNAGRFRPGIGRSGFVKALLGESPYIVYVGRVNEKKGVGDLLKAYLRLAAQEGAPRLVISGTGSAGFVERLKRLAASSGLGEGVVFSGPVPNREVPSLLSNSLFMVYPTRGGEGIPRAILETMACGRPVVATKVAGIPDAVRDGETGFLVEPRSIDQLTSRMATLVRDTGLADEMGRRARRLVEEEFSYEAVVPRLVKLFEELAADG